MFEVLGDIDEKYLSEVRNVNRDYKESVQKKEKATMRKFFRRPTVAVATLAICVCLAGVTALATSDNVKGFFKDIIRWDGAVIGTEYEQATDELELAIGNVDERIHVEVKMVTPDVAPYSFFELFGIASYKIMDLDGNVMVEGSVTEMAEITNGIVNLSIPCDGLSVGEYELVVDKMVGSSKGDQPLELSGVWKGEFLVE